MRPVDGSSAAVRAPFAVLTASSRRGVPVMAMTASVPSPPEGMSVTSWRRSNSAPSGRGPMVMLATRRPSRAETIALPLAQAEISHLSSGS